LTKVNAGSEQPAQRVAAGAFRFRNKEHTMQLARWNPFREMDDMLARFQRGFGDSLLSDEGLPIVNWAPAVDISETPKEYLIKAELPGVKKEEVKVTVHNGVLTMSGERKTEKEQKDEKYHRIERTYGSFTRSFSLPNDAAEDRVSAECKDGVVTIHVARTEAPKPKQIEVKVN
jgi:HSP20 family protein